MSSQYPFTFAVILAATLILGGCTDDETNLGEPEGPFSVTVTVVNLAGQPLEGEQVALLPGLPEGILEPWLQRNSKMPAATEIQIQVDHLADVSLTVNDNRGNLVRTLVADTMEGGLHHIMWNGSSDSGEYVADGWYEVQFSCRDTDTSAELYSTSIGALLLRVSQWGVLLTNVEGQVSFTDRWRVLGFLGAPPVEFRNEQGTLLGVAELTNEMWVIVGDTRARFTAVDGPQAITVTLQDYRREPPLEAAKSIADSVPQGMREGEYSVRVIPNPFD